MKECLSKVRLCNQPIVTDLVKDEYSNTVIYFSNKYWESNGADPAESMLRIISINVLKVSRKI
jgi:hypothetical protein